MIITESDLHALMPKADVALWHGPLTHAMAAAGLCTPKRASMFLAHVAHESAELTRVEENLNYSRDRLLAVWPTRFDPAMAAKCARRPEQIANIAYAGRMGNGDAKSGDGWRFRGRGPFQITGRGNYRECGEFIGVDLEATPERLLSPTFGSKSAVWFFIEKARGYEGADRGDLEGVTRRINGGLNGLAERRAYYTAALRRFA